MKINSKDIIQNLFDSNEISEIFFTSQIGIEKESLRVNGKAISKELHPSSLGSSLCNKFITTDFAEAQLEFITVPKKKEDDLLVYLDNLHHYYYQNVEDELLWPSSMPPYIEKEGDLRIAKYGKSDKGKFKELYRKGLEVRYGKYMQAISGLHFNFSFSNDLFEYISLQHGEADIKSVRSKYYFRLIRNVIRYNWLVKYLFGSTPYLTRNFMKSSDHSSLKLNDNEYLFEAATSLRMSNDGYQNRDAQNVRI